MDNQEKGIRKIQLTSEMKTSFMNYAMSVIVARALPDVRDGMKPVQRRIVYGMNELGCYSDKAYKKSARIVGEVMGKYHPHGDSSIYEALVRMAQDFSYRYMLVDGHGNFGSIDGDGAAAMRYTEARMSKISMELMRDINKDTIDFIPNYDGEEREPSVLPCRIPNLLVNGTTGIAVGMATNMPPHNIGEVIDAVIAVSKNPDISVMELMENYIQGPDFPTGAIVEGIDGIRNAFEKGKGKVIVRAKTEIVEQKNMNQIVVTEIPYEVNKAELVRKIDEIRFNKNIDGILEVRDESDREGLRVVIDLKKTVNVQNTLNYFYKNTDLQKNYNYNMVAIKDKRPVLMGIVDILDGYIDHQIDVVTRASLYDLSKANERLHIVDGLIKAISILDDVVKTIRSSKDKADAKKNLILEYQFSEKQAEAIVMLQLYRLTNTDIVSLQEEKAELEKRIHELNEILDSDDVLRNVIIKRLREIKQKYPMPRLTQIKEKVSEVKIDEKAMIISEDIYVSITRDGYIKRISQRSINASTNIPFGKKDDDILISLYKANTLNHLLLFTNKGNYLFVPVHKIEEFKWKDLGKHVSYLVKVNSDEKIISTILVKDFNLPLYVLLATKNGQIKRTLLKDFEVTRYSKSIMCMKVKDNDEVVSAKLTDAHQGIFIATRAGYGGLYSEQEVSVIGLKAAGIKALNLKEDTIQSVETFNPMETYSIMLFSEDGQIKRLKLSDVPACKRTTKGITLYKNLKTKTIYVHSALIMTNKDEAKVYTDQEIYDFKATDFNYATLESRFSSFIKLKKDEHIQCVLKDHSYSTSDYDTLKENKSEEVLEVKEVKEKTLLDDYDIQEIETPKNHKTSIKKETTTKYEKISLEDILKDDNF